MSDVASILGIKNSSSSNLQGDAKLFLDPVKPKSVKPKVAKPAGMSRELFQLVGNEGVIAPSVPSASPVYKSRKVTNLAKGKWIWTSFTNSARR